MKNKKVPVLRFPEFLGEWEEKKINEITSYVDYRGKTPEKSDSGIFLITARNIREGYIDYECSKEYIPVETYEEVMRRGKPLIGDVLITTEAPCGNIASIDKEGIALAQRVIKFRGKENIYNYFLKFYFLSDFFQKKLFEKATGGTVKGIKGSQLHKMTVKFPTFPEQQKIADFLTQIDNKINQLSQKKQLLERYKKGVMQQIFSQSIRFTDDDGREFPEWEEKEIGDVFQVTRGNVLAMPLVNNTQNKENPYPVYSSQTKNNGLSGFYKDFLYENCITWTTDGANAGDVNYRNGKFYCTNVCGVLVNKNGFANACIASMINAISKNYVSYVGNPKLMNNIMAKISINFPCVEEQTKIANFLTALDTKIALVESQLNGTKQYKKGLLQQLFV